MTKEKVIVIANLMIENGKLGSIRFVKMEHILRVLGYDLCLTPFNPFRKEEPFMCGEED